MTTAKPPEPFFKVARIVYFTDLTKASSRVIPLGSFGEVMLPHVHALGLKARSSLTREELALIAPLLRDRLESPFKFLRAEFNLAWETGGFGRALELLTTKHSSSLSILTPTDVPDRHWLLQRLLPVRDDAVEGKLSSAIDHEFSELVKSYGDQVASERKVIEVDIDRAAAA
jgi:hypothetical protein